ncbi:MAG: AI-2E family transporter [Clostridia bacterium]
MNPFFRAVLIVVAVLLLPKVLGLIAPFIIGFLIYLICRKSVRRMARVGICRSAAALFAVAFVIAITAALFGLIFTAAYNESEQLPILYQKVASIQPESEIGQKFMSVFRDEIISMIRTVSMKLLSYLGNVTGLLMIMLFSFISAFFFLKDEKKIVDIILRNGGAGFLDSIQRLKKTISGALGGYVRAQLILMVITFSILSVFFVLFGVDCGVLIALGIAFLDAIPVFGTGCILLPWALYQFIFGSRSLAFGLLAVYGVCSLTRQILEPKIISSQIGLHPLLTLAGVFIGFKLLGFWGLILGPAAMLVFVTYIQNRQ